MKKKKVESTIFYKKHVPLSVSFMSNYDNEIHHLCARNENEID